MMDDTLLHPVTKANLHRIVANPPHAILLTGIAGSGKTYVAEQLAASILSIGADKLALHPYRYVVAATDNKAISIEQIRELQKKLTLRTTGSTSKIRRLLCIYGADNMTTEAQNALLKTLEEPPQDTVIILTAHQYEDLLPTIRSRVQRIPVLPVGLTSAQQYFVAKNIQLPDIVQAHAVSGGAVGLLMAIIYDAQDHPLIQDIRFAKELLGLTTYERLCRVDEISKQTELPGRTLEALCRICIGALRANLRSKQIENAHSWLQRVGSVCDAQEALAKNANPKIVLTDLLLSL